MAELLKDELFGTFGFFCFDAVASIDIFKNEPKYL
jgi:hypothetical protein